jgi:peroxiredoxin
MTNLLEGAKAPDFTLGGLDGKEYSLASLLRHGPVVLTFFKISCPVCQFTFPFLQRLHSRFNGLNATIVSVSQDDTRDTTFFNKEHGIHFLTLVDEHPYPVSSSYGLTNVPTIFLIEPDGTIKVSCEGFSKGDLERIAENLTARENLPSIPFFTAEDRVPDYKPG